MINGREVKDFQISEEVIKKHASMEPQVIQVTYAHEAINVVDHVSGPLNPLTPQAQRHRGLIGLKYSRPDPAQGLKADCPTESEV